MEIGRGVLSAVFLALRQVAGPFHRRRPTREVDQNDRLAPLPAPWTDAKWFRGGFPPRQRNELTALVDGQEYFGDLLRAMGEARKRVTICGWDFTALMALAREERQGEAVLAEVLREVSARAEVYVLLWSGAPALFKPTTEMISGAQETLRRIAPRVRCELDHRAPFSHDHHQKAVTVDGRVAYVGGMDVTTYEGDRWDTSAHPLRLGPNWHDVQIRMRGEVVADVEENFCQRWNAVTGERLTPLPATPEGETPAQIVRTVPKGFYPFAPHGEFGIYHALVTAIRQAQQLVYLENQYIWSPEIKDALLEVMNRRGEQFRVVIVLPAKALLGRYDNDAHVRQLETADAGRGMFHPYALYATGPALGATGYRAQPIYVHAKVSIVDDQWFAVGSANLNGRGLATDTEMDVQSIAPEVARGLRVRLWAEHLGLPEAEVAAADPIALVDGAWREAAEEMEESIRSGGRPPRGQVRRYVPARGPESRALDLLEGITLEH